LDSEAGKSQATRKKKFLEGKEKNNSLVKEKGYIMANPESFGKVGAAGSHKAGGLEEALWGGGGTGLSVRRNTRRPPGAEYWGTLNSLNKVGNNKKYKRSREAKAERIQITPQTGWLRSPPNSE